MTRTKRRARFAGAAVVAGAAVGAVTGGSPPAVGAASRPVVIGQGHIDALDVAYEDGGLEVAIHDETVVPDVERDPDEVLLVALPGARTTVPDDPAYGFLGRPGASVWVLPEVEDPALLWPGIATEEVEAGVFEGDVLRLRLVRVVGPGEVALFTTDAFGAPDVVFDSGDGLPDRSDLPVGTHAHANWAFDRPGDYRLVFEVSGRLADGSGVRVSSGRVALAFEVRR